MPVLGAIKLKVLHIYILYTNLQDEFIELLIS